ncbi:anti-sigma factor [Streptomyces sp. NPDC048845]|uniref:anti-sigma factor n=1 Tax=Streptomyces sp. NPDC048845 TaxID=3155390 RepID=UPI003416C31B
MKRRATGRRGGTELHTLTGAYALHALPEEDRAAFEAHLGACPACAQEVSELTATAARIGSAESVEPPPRLRAEVLRRAAATRQEPPRTPGRSARGPGRPGTRHGGRTLTRFLLAACLAAAAALGGVSAWQYQQARDARSDARRAEQRSQDLARVLTAPDARSITGLVGTGATGTAVVSRGEDRAVFLASGLPRLAADRVYQLWFDDHGTMRPAGVMDLRAEAGAVLLEGRVGEAVGLGITVEPAGGSPRPTGEPLAVMEFPAE